MYSFLHEAVAINPTSNSINSVYQNSELSSLLWKTLLPHLNGITTIIYLALDNNLHKVNINALMIDNKNTANDVFDIVVLNSTRDVLKIKQKPNTETQPKEALVIGNICFNSTLDRVKKSNNKIHGNTPTFKKVSSSSKNSPKWKPLIYSAEEIKSITKSLIQSNYFVKELSQNNALEQYLKKYKYVYKTAISPQIIHFSTHGYFIRQYQEENKKICDCGFDVKSTYFDSPNCGLILSGVNNNISYNTSSNSADDGILSAKEIMQLNLNNTELIVLSACNTGLGDIHSTEGVYGLGRAFKIAGVNKIIMTLWQVPDYQTMELITLFYNNLLIRKLCPRKALHEAQKTMRLKKYEPYYWAGFIIVE
jgi:CHAT domain-containing protein